ARTFLTPSVMWDDAIGDGDDVRFWDVATRRELAGLPGQESFGVSALALSADGRTLVSGGLGGILWLWDPEARRGRPALFAPARSQTEWERWQSAHRLGIKAYPDYDRGVRWSLALAPDGKTLAVATSAGPVQLREVPGGRELGSLPGGPGLGACAAFSPDGATLALWDVARRELRHTLSGHTDDVGCLAFSPDGGLLATGGRDRSIKLWELPAGREKATLISHTDRVVSLTFSPDGRTLASGSWDGTV